MMRRWWADRGADTAMTTIASVIAVVTVVAVFVIISQWGSWFTELPHVGWPHAAFLAYVLWSPVLTGLDELVHHLAVLTGRKWRT